MSYFLDEDKTWIERDFGLDRRLIKALSKLGFVYPTLVQAKCIPIITQGKDVLVRAKTGSGKTIAFALPVLQKILSSKEAQGQSAQSIRCILLAPTKELVKQIEKHMNDLIYYCRETISICSLADDSASVQRYRLQSRPDVVISTPARLIQNLKNSELDLSSVDTLVMDEADLVLSFGYAEDVHAVISRLPKIFQGVLVSATLSAELDKFKKVVLHKPAVLRLEEPEGAANLLQFFLRCSESDKFLILYVFVKLGLLQGKGLIFVNDVNKCYKLRLFLQQFGVSSAVLNAEVPLNSRLHILEEFNRGVFDFLIATDASVDRGEEDDEEEGKGAGADSGDEEGSGEEDSVVHSRGAKRGKQQSSGAKAAAGVDYGVSRGIDFQGVSFVVNFDFPASAAAYTHRVGRTGRGGASGTALSFVGTTGVSAPTKEIKAAQRDEETLQVVREQQPRTGSEDSSGNVLAAIGAAGTERQQAVGADGEGREVAAMEEEARKQPAPLQFNMLELESFRYRVEDTLRSVTVAAVREMRAAELKREILNSERLKSFFAENPNDLKVLRHDKAIAHPIRQQDHLKNVPDYLLPASMRGATVLQNKKGRKRKPAGSTGSAAAGVEQSRKRNPLYNPEGAEEGGSSRASSASTMPQAKVFSNNDCLGDSMSGRKMWKQKHKKGAFNPKVAKGSQHRVAGTFANDSKVKSKKAKRG